LRSVAIEPDVVQEPDLVQKAKSLNDLVHAAP